MVVELDEATQATEVDETQVQTQPCLLRPGPCPRETAAVPVPEDPRPPPAVAVAPVPDAGGPPAPDASALAAAALRRQLDVAGRLLEFREERQVDAERYVQAIPLLRVLPTPPRGCD